MFAQSLFAASLLVQFPTPPLLSLESDGHRLQVAQVDLQGSARQARSAGYLGVSLREGAGEGAGLVIVSIAPGSPAAQAGLADGDRVLTVDGDAVGSLSDFTAAIRRRQPGTEVQLAIERDLELQVASKSGEDGTDQPRIGVNLQAADGDGFVEVDSTVDGMPAERAGVQAGDRLLAIGGVRLESFEQLRDLVRSHAADGELVLRIGRDVEARLGAIAGQGIATGPGAGVAAPTAPAEPTAPGQSEPSFKSPKDKALKDKAPKDKSPKSRGPATTQAPESLLPRVAPVAPPAHDGDLHQALSDFRRELEVLRQEIQDLRREIQGIRRNGGGAR